jgi:hypothetical protein
MRQYIPCFSYGYKDLIAFDCRSASAIFLWKLRGSAFKRQNLCYVIGDKGGKQVWYDMDQARLRLAQIRSAHESERFSGSVVPTSFSLVSSSTRCRTVLLIAADSASIRMSARTTYSAALVSGMHHHQLCEHLYGDHLCRLRHW